MQSNIEHLASNIEHPLVKPLHPIDEIAARISQADGAGVRLVSDRAANDAIVADPAEAIARALTEPLAFPPLAAGIVAGDRVAIAVDRLVPCLGGVVRGTVHALQRAGIELSDV